MIYESQQYIQFVEKFNHAKTTDDCYTPPNIYEGIKNWACKEYSIDEKTIVRPFYPDLDYRQYDYPDGCFVLDNPPFSLLAQIVRFYMKHKVRFFLFGPALTIFTAPEAGANYVCVNTNITFENNADIAISFVTSEGRARIRSAPELYDIIDNINEQNLKKQKKQMRKLSIPIEVATASRIAWLSVHHTPFEIMPEDCMYIRKMEAGLDVFGGGFLLSERAAAERAAAASYLLTEHEKQLQKMLGKERKDV